MKSSGSVLRRVSPPGRRFICIGDIHGCHDELAELLARISPTAGDLVVSTGDIVRKGPDPVACLELWRDRGYLAVTGNNEEKLLELAAANRARQLLTSAQDRAVLRRPDLLEFIRGWPILIDVPAMNAAVVHGGLFPAMAIDVQTVGRLADDIIRLRWIRREDGQWHRGGKTRERPDDVLWAEVWDGPRTVLYGHTPLREPRVDGHAIGLDTGCVYGGWLTAAVLDGKWSFERVKARRQYAD